MNPTHVIVGGTLRSDGSLELDGKLDLPPGRVQLIVQPLPDLPKDNPFWQMMERIWADREAAGLDPRDVREVAMARKKLRDEMDEEIERAGRLRQDGVSQDHDGVGRLGRTHDRPSRRQYRDLPGRAEPFLGTQGLGTDRRGRGGSHAGRELDHAMT